jgi:hypothetical protein
MTCRFGGSETVACAWIHAGERQGWSREGLVRSDGSRCQCAGADLPQVTGIAALVLPSTETSGATSMATAEPDPIRCRYGASA